MRLIDKDALIADCQLAQKQADRHGREFSNAFYSGGGDISTEWWCVEDMIENAPTIEERKRGEWIEDAETFYKAVNEKGGGVNEDTPFFTEDDVACSECLTLFNVLENRTDIFDFCPHCGADMRGGKGEPNEN